MLLHATHLKLNPVFTGMHLSSNGTGIGYFTLPYLVHAGATHVHACEWNPTAVEALRRNLQLNKVSDRCTVHQGDNRKVKHFKHVMKCIAWPTEVTLVFLWTIFCFQYSFLLPCLCFESIRTFISIQSWIRFFYTDERKVEPLHKMFSSTMHTHFLFMYENYFLCTLNHVPIIWARWFCYGLGKSVSPWNLVQWTLCMTSASLRLLYFVHGLTH